MNIQRSAVRILQMTVVIALTVGSGVFVAGFFGYADASKIAWIALIAAGVGALAALSHMLLSHRQMNHHAP